MITDGRPGEAWARMAPEAIPTKPTLHPAFEDALAAAFQDSSRGTGHGGLLDLGCGDGSVALALAARHTGIKEMVGVDINSGAISMANGSIGAAAAAAADGTTGNGTFFFFKIFSS